MNDLFHFIFALVFIACFVAVGIFALTHALFTIKIIIGILALIGFLGILGAIMS